MAVLFIFGWNRYLWPLMTANTQDMRVVVTRPEGLTPRSGTELPAWNLLMAGATMALPPPTIVIGDRADAAMELINTNRP